MVRQRSVLRYIITLFVIPSERKDFPALSQTRLGGTERAGSQGGGREVSLVGEAGWGMGGGDWLGQSKGDKAKTEGHLREGTERVNSFSFPQYLFSPNTIFSRTRHCFHLQNSNFFQNLPQFYLLSLKTVSYTHLTLPTTA